MYRYLRRLNLTGLFFACCLLLSLQAAAQEMPPQQSTSGPIAPPSTIEKAGIKMAPPAQGGLSRIISGVPGYAWQHGCGPTAVGMVIGYYDEHGFGDLFAGDAVSQTEAVNQGIASQGSGIRGVDIQRHYEDYVLPMDSSEPTPLADSSETYPAGCHTDDSIADYMHTSWSVDGNFYGWSWSNRITSSFASYVTQQKAEYLFSTDSHYMSFGSLNWSVLTEQIDNNRPMVFLVDSDGNGGTDHFVTVIGYSDAPPQQYVCLDTWYPYDEVRWCDFSEMVDGTPWGIWGGWSFALQCSLTTQASNGSVSRTPNQQAYDFGTPVTLAAIPDPGYHFLSWAGDVPTGEENTNPRF